MQRHSLSRSVRFNVIAAISVMGLLGLSFALLSGEWYKRLVFENEQQLQRSILAYETEQYLKDHAHLSRDLSAALQQSSELRTALRQQDRASLIHLLNGQFHQYLVTTDQLQLLRLGIYDANFQLVAQSTENTSLPLDWPACQRLLDHARMRSGADRLKAVSDLCPDPRYALHAELTPIGGLRPIGYVLVITSPLHTLLEIGREMHSPLDIRLPNNQLVGSSQDKPPASTPQWGSVSYTLRNHGGIPALRLQLHKDAAELNRKLTTTRLTIMAISTTFTLLAMVLAFSIMRQNLLAPLAHLTRKVQSIRQSRSHLGEQVPPQGSNEIQELARSFNDMSTELADLYRQLEQQAFSDPLTHLPNRGWFHDQLHRLQVLADREHGGFALLMLDLNKFKPINDRFGHQIGDLVLRTTADRINAVIRGSDYLARVALTAPAGRKEDALARMGGDEFAILLPTTTNCQDTARVAEKIAESVSQPIDVDGRRMQIGISIGAALYPADADSIDLLIYRADLAMYHAKSHRLAFRCYDPELEDPVRAV